MIVKNIRKSASATNKNLPLALVMSSASADYTIYNYGTIETLQVNCEIVIKEVIDHY